MCVRATHSMILRCTVRYGGLLCARAVCCVLG